MPHIFPLRHTFESLGVNNMEIQSKTWKTIFFQNIAGLGIFRNALVVQQYPQKTRKGFIWSRSMLPNIERTNAYIGMFLNSYSWIDITFWKKNVTKTFSPIKLINFTSLTHKEPRLLPRHSTLKNFKSSS